MNERALGALASGLDYRDGIAAVAVEPAAQLPYKWSTDISRLPVLDQNKIPACVSHAFVILMQAYWFKRTGRVIDFSPRFLDILSAESFIPIDGGRVPRTVCKVAAEFGCATTATLPNDTVGLSIPEYRSKSAITQAARDEALQYKIPGYIRIGDSAVVDFRTAMRVYGLVSGCFSIGNEWWTRRDGISSWDAKEISPLRTPAKPVGGHMVTVRAYEGDYNVLRNSWSRDWGDSGEASYSASKWLPWILEGWVITDIPEDVKLLLADLPRPDDFHYRWERDMQIGETSDDVKFAQIALMILGLLKPVMPDELGVFGPKTAKAVLAYQSRVRISANDRNPNRIGPRTRAGLNAEFSI